MTDNQFNQFPTPPASSLGANPEPSITPSPANEHPGTQTTAPAIEIKGVSKLYGSQIGLANANLTLPSGGIVGLMGPNGCGKTTLMKILAGVMQDYEGEVRLFGKTREQKPKLLPPTYPTVLCWQIASLRARQSANTRTSSPTLIPRKPTKWWIFSASRPIGSYLPCPRGCEKNSKSP